MTNIPDRLYVSNARKSSSIMKFLLFFFLLCFAHSVASAMASDTPERYERLTSVSSSVDIDQRDTVSTLYTYMCVVCTQVHKYTLVEIKAVARFLQMIH